MKRILCTLLLLGAESAGLVGQAPVKSRPRDAAVTPTMGDKSYQVAASFSETKSGGEGQKTARKVAGGAGLGAIAGGLADGGKDAGTGALVGVAGGTIIAATGQPHLKVPSETRLEFQLIMDWRI